MPCMPLILIKVHYGSIDFWTNNDLGAPSEGVGF
jgi:hypothetical protein